MKSPLIIIAELIFGVISAIYQTIVFVVSKFGELMVSLLFLSTFGVFGFFLAIAIGTMVFLLIAKLIFKSSKNLLAFGISFIVVVLVLVILWMI